MTADQLFDAAVAATGVAYLDAERDVRALGAAVLPTLQRRLADPDLVAAALAALLTQWINAQPREFTAALKYLEDVGIKFEKTAAGVPPPLGVATYLERHFGNRVADLLAIRLYKAVDWPHWKVMGVLFYLEAQKVPTTVPVLIRFAIETSNAEWRTAAIEAVRSAGDPDLRQRLDSEMQRAAKAGRPIPAEVQAL